MVSSALPNSGVCAIWGSSHVRTYDGGIYSFQGSCTYLLSKDCEQNTFAVHINNPVLCETVSCITSVTIYVGSEEYILTNSDEGGPVVINAGKAHTIPTSMNGLLFQMMSDYVVVSSSLGFRYVYLVFVSILIKCFVL